MVAAAVLLVVVTAVFMGVYSGLRLQATSRQRATATDWADHLMEQARNLRYDGIGLLDKGAGIDAAIAAIPAGESDHPDRLLRRDTASNCLELNSGSTASPVWERLVLADWYTPPSASTTCATQSGGEGDKYTLRHAGGSNDYTPAGSPAVTYTGWVFVSWAPVQGVSPTTYYKRVTVLVRYPSPTGGISRVVRESSLFSLGYVPTPSSSSTSSTSTSTTTTTTLGATTTTLPLNCTPKAGDTEAPVGSIRLAGGDGYTNQTILTIENSMTDLPHGSGASGMGTMQYSNSGAAGPWEPVPAVAYDLAYSGWPVAAGDGEKRVWARFTDCNGNTSAVVSDTIVLDQTRPPAPTGLSASAKNNKVDLTWDPVVDTGSGVAGYRVYRDGTALSQSSGTSDSDNSVVSRQPYTYTVRAVDQAGNEGPDSASVTATPS
jgi:hypothetical protein